MIDRDAARRAMAANYRRTMELLAEHAPSPRAGVRSFGAVEAITLDHAVPFYNAVLALDPTADVRDVEAALDWIESLGSDPSVHVIDGADPALTGMLAARGLTAADPSPAMALAPIPATLDAPLPAGATLRIGGGELADDWYAALEVGERFQATFARPMLAEPDVRVAVADVDGDLVAGAMAVRSDEDALGVYVVATAERARRRGLGRAVTAAVIRAGAETWGTRTAVLQATEMGRPVYAALGFVEIGTVTIVTRP